MYAGIRKMLQPMKMTFSALRALSCLCCLNFALAVAGMNALKAQVAAPGTIAVKPGAVAALAPASGPTYDNQWEIYGGLLYMNGQAGQALPKHYNMGGGEVEATYWLGGPANGYIRSHLGVSAEARFAAGTTPVLPNQYNLNRILIQQTIGAGGLTWRGPKNRYVAIDYHALGGVDYGKFDTAITGYPPSSQGVVPPSTQSVGVYSNHTAGWGVAGGSIDFNQGPKFSVRLSPDLVFEHFGTDTKEFFSISLGVMYRFGKKR
jgi:hypothetical protein